jgi:ABC-type transporter Mla subunit MlaD
MALTRSSRLLHAALEEQARTIGELLADLRTANARLRDDRDTIGELAGAHDRHEPRLEQLTNAVAALSLSVASLRRTLDARTERAA